MVVALIALLVALAGSGYAAVTINGKNLKNRSVAGTKLMRNTVGGVEVNEAKLGPVPRADNANQLGGLAPSAFLPAAGTAANAERLDGRAATAFLAAGATAANADKLDGQDANAFLAAGATAVDADKLDGRDASGFGQILDSGTKTTTLTPLDAGACANDGPITTAPAGKLVIPFGANFPNNRLVAIPDSTIQLGPQVAAFWKVCNVSNATLDPGTVTTRFVVLGP